MKAKIYKETLSDGSHAFDIEIFESNYNKMEFAALSEKDAQDFCFGLNELVKKHLGVVDGLDIQSFDHGK